MSKKTSTPAKLFMASLIIVLCFGGVYMSGEEGKSKKSKMPGQKDIECSFYLWEDDSGNSYVTVKSTKPVDPKTIYPQAPDIELIPVDKEVPIKPGKGFQIKTYRLVQKFKKSCKIVENNDLALIYLIGETHLGESQKDVAKIMCDLIKENDIDAIFIEQPDHLDYNWANYRSLEKEPKKAIAILREQMLFDSQRKSDYNFGKYKKYFKGLNRDIKEISRKIYNDYGNEGISEVSHMIKSQQEEVKKTFNVYERSEYISAADYFYIMLNLQGINIPFHNLESVKLRKEFMNKLKNKSSSGLMDDDLEARDNYMLRKTKKIIKSKGYRKIILICGAFHLNNLKSKLTKAGLKVNIVYDSMADDIKKELAALVNPQYILDLVRNNSTPLTARFDEYINKNEPSGDLLNPFNNFLKSKGNHGLNSQQILHLRNRLSKEYRTRELKAKTNWEIEFPLKDGRKIYFIKNSRANKIEIIMEKPADLKKLMQLEKTDSRHHFVDFKNIRQLNKINRDNSGIVSTFTVENHRSHFEVYHNSFESVYEGNDIAQLFKAVRQKSARHAAYMDMKNFTPDKKELFDKSLQMQKLKYNVDLRIVTLGRVNNSTDSRDTFLMDSNIKLSSKHKPKPVESRDSEGKSLFRITINFLLKFGNTLKQVSITFVAKTQEMALKFYDILTSKIPSHGFNGSLASLVNQGIRDLTDINEDKDEEKMKIKFEDQFGNILYVFIRRMLAPNHKNFLKEAA